MLAWLGLVKANDVWSVVSDIKTEISLTAFALAVVLAVMLAWLKTKRRKVPVAFWIIVVLLVLIGVGSQFFKPTEYNPGIYRLRVTVLGLDRSPDENAIVWSDFGGEPKKVAGGWQFDIPADSKPKEGKLTVYAKRDSDFLTGQSQVPLGRDFNPAVTITLSRDSSARIHGQVVDTMSRAIAGARVLVVGFESESIITKEGGNFDLPAHAAFNQQVLLHAEKTNYRPTKLWHPAGDTPAVLMLER